MILIGLAGKAEHGKSAGSRIIKEWTERRGCTCEIFEVSKLILDECYALGLIPDGQPRDQNNKEQNKILVDHGSKQRESNPNYWTDLITAQMLASKADVTVCPNIRFPQEAQAIRNSGGYIIRMNRVNDVAHGLSPFISLSRDPNHLTETAVDNWPADFIITNVTGHGGLLEGLVAAVMNYVAENQTRAGG